MKKLLLILGFCCTVNLLSAQVDQPSFRDNKHNLIGNIQNGTIVDQNNNFLGQFRADKNQWSIIDSHHKTVGYIVGGNEIQDLGHNTVGYLVNGSDYSVTVQNAEHTVVGRIKSDGTVESASHGIIGYATHTEPMWAAPYFFFFKL